MKLDSLEAKRPVGNELDIAAIRAEFPVLSQRVHGKPLVYLDNAATSQKPHQVMDAMLRFYNEDCSNIHRGVHALSERSTDAYEQARVRIQKYLNAASADEIVFVRGTTEAINLVAATFGKARVGQGDEILVTQMEHHSNIVPWQMLAQEKGARVTVLPMNERGELRLDELPKLLTPRTKLFAFTHVSNALGTVNPARDMIRMAHERGIPVVVDGAQSAPHFAIDLGALDADFYTLSAHKIFGPTGVGVLYGKKALLEAMPPYQGGGHMIHTVSFSGTTYAPPPHKFEAGTAHIAGGIGFGAAIDYVERLGIDRIEARERRLLEYGTEALRDVPGLRPIGTAREKAGVLSFVLGDIHPHDVGTILDQEGIAIRVGHHCAQPVMEFYKVPATCRASLAFYNTEDEIDRLAAGLRKVREVFG